MIFMEPMIQQRSQAVMRYRDEDRRLHTSFRGRLLEMVKVSSILTCSTKQGRRDTTERYDRVSIRFQSPSPVTFAVRLGCTAINLGRSMEDGCESGKPFATVHSSTVSNPNLASMQALSFKS